MPFRCRRCTEERRLHYPIANAFLFVWDIDDFAILKLVGGAHTLALVARLGVLVLRRSIAVYLLALLRDDFHILLARVLHHGKVFRAEHFGHLVMGYECHHQCDGKHHCGIEEVADNAHRVVVLVVAEPNLSSSHNLFAAVFVQHIGNVAERTHISAVPTLPNRLYDKADAACEKTDNGGGKRHLHVVSH